MRNRAGNKILAFALAAVLLLGGVFAAPPMTAYAVDIGTRNDLNPALAERKANPQPSDSAQALSSPTLADSTVVWFGGYQWVVIGWDGDGVASEADTATLIYANANTYKPTGRFDNDGTSNTYVDSDLRTAITNFYNNLPAKEKGYIISRSLTGDSGLYTYGGGSNINVSSFYNAADVQYLPANPTRYINAYYLNSGDTFDWYAYHNMRTANNGFGYSSDTPYTGTYHPDNIAGGGTTGDNFWPLSVVESSLLDESIRTYSNAWWLRSPGHFTDNAAVVTYDGHVYAVGSPVDGGVSSAIRPAFYLDLESVIFTSAANNVSGKSTATAGSGLVGASAPTGAIKLTVLDSGQTLEVVATTAQSTQSGASLIFSYKDATVDANNQYISCFLEKQGAGDDYYGKLIKTDDGSEESGTLSIPLSDVDDGTYTLKIFSEQANDPYYTDFCSTPVTMTVVVDASGNGTVSGFTGTVLSNDAGLVSVAGESISAGSETGDQTTPKTASISVANSKASIESSDIIAATDATAALYSDDAFSQNENQQIMLTEGVATHAYIKVTAEDSSTAYYDITINRAAAPPSFTNTNSYTCVEGTGGSHTFTASGTAPITFAITESLPNGVSFSDPTLMVASTAAAGTYSLTVTASNSTSSNAQQNFTLTISDTPVASLTVQAPSFTPVTLGYSQRPGAESITIDNSGGNANATINSVTVSGTAFEIGGSGLTVTSGSAITTWTVQPILGLSAGTHTETITVTYNTVKTATAQVSFTVNGAQQTLYPLTVQNGSGGGSFAAGAAVPISASIPSGAVFSGWTSGAGGSFAGAGNRNTDFTMPANSVTVTANYYWPSGGGGSSSSDNDTTPSYPIEVEKKPDQPARAVTNINNAAPDKNNALAYTITKEMVQRALDEAKKNGGSANGYALVWSFTTGENINSMNITFAADALALLEKEGVKETAVTTNAFRFSLDLAAITEINKQSGGRAVTVSSVRTDKLSDEAKRLIGSRPAWDVNLLFTKDGQSYTINNLGKGSITLGMRYVPKAGEKTGNLAAIYVPGSGKPQTLTQSSYDNGWMIWKRGTLSLYGVGYITPAPAFTDTVNHWAKDNIDFVAGRGLLTGTGAATFSPGTAITRGMFVTALGRLSGQDMSGYTSSSFSDVAAGSYYLPYIEWAVKNNIVSGTGGGKFSPDAGITREDMAVMMENYAKATKYTLPVARQAVTFADEGQISAYAKDAVKALQQAGVVSGVGNNRFNPKGTATRAEAATILRNFVELVIDPGTTRGWVKNDAGQQMYYTWDGRRVTGWLTTTAGSRYWFDESGIMQAGKWVQIGGKWYYFDADGKLATNTTIDGYEIGADGARKGK